MGRATTDPRLERRRVEEHHVMFAYQDAGSPVATRVEDLLSRMTLVEKIGQLNQRLLGWQAWDRETGAVRTTTALDEEIARWGGIGAVYGLLRADAWSGRDWRNGADPAQSLEVTAAVQERVVAGSRLGIPALFVEEAPHGHQALGSQLFPVNLAAAATWDPSLVEEAAAHSARELRARGAHIALVSGLDMLRDPRWGRAEECFGEDPLLASMFVRAVVRGMNREPGLAVVLKHFAGQGAGIGGRNSSGAPIGQRELAEVHLPAARAGVEEGALGLMAAYNDIDGIPCCANRALLTDTLRDAWQFEGIVMADMYAVDRLMRSAPSAAAAGALALRAGVDMSMCDLSYQALEEAVGEGLATEEDLDRAARRVLALKFRLGLFDASRDAPPFPTPSATTDYAPATLTLLQNRGGLLPLARPPGRVAVLGPNADDLQCLRGDYVPPLAPGTRTTVLDAVRELVGDDVSYEPGCGRTASIEGGLERARAVASAADLAIVVLGSTSERAYDDDFAANGAGSLGRRQPSATTGEGFDVAEVTLPTSQCELAVTVAATGTPTFAVIVSGRPLGLDAVAAACDALIYAWYPGPEGARAIAAAVLGDREPTGRLPASLPHSSGTLPVAYDERLETTQRYVDSEAAALFPFGAGLGYTMWRLGDAAAGADHVSSDGVAGLSVSVQLANVGIRRGNQLVQLYARLRVPGVVPRRAVLVGFVRVTLDPGEEVPLRIPVQRDALPGLGLTGGTSGMVELWCSVDGPGDPDDGAVRVRILDGAEVG